jgi:hypothetical protein
MSLLKNAGIGLTLLATAFAATTSLGQTTPPSRVYHLRSGSLDQEGCFGACACAVQLPDAMRGTFVLTPTTPDPLYQNYTISNVQWRVPALPRTLAGSGTYRIGGEVAIQQQMTLQLNFNGQQTLHNFDSGLVGPSSPGFPVIHIHLHVPNSLCWNTELEVLATPFIGDWNADGVLQAQDIFDFLNSWFAGDGDANEDGVTNLQDVFDFVNGWFAGT